MSLNKTELQTPDWLNSGDNAWQLTASSLVALQSIPGLVAIYAGLVKTKWAINSAFMCFYAFAAVMICWGVWGYSMSFGAEMIPGLVGIPKPMLSSMTELTQVNLLSALAIWSYTNQIAGKHPKCWS
jgi:Amt family ammonium transporter